MAKESDCWRALERAIFLTTTTLHGGNGGTQRLAEKFGVAGQVSRDHRQFGKHSSDSRFWSPLTHLRSLAPTMSQRWESGMGHGAAASLLIWKQVTRLEV